ncbi:MAG: YaeQ family protein [Sandaracinaceae bacterium]|nr:YaeQ family protein [Myxococcales bacterium]MCB9659275.1 YaeQ family protein [Sandaracinaceae bacterium]
MAQATVLLRVGVELADVDRGVYETLDLRVAQHPSESEARVVVRVLARCLLHEEGLEFGRGLSNVDEPALSLPGAHGGHALWVDLGAPSADRVHRASKLAERVAIVTDKDAQTLRKEWGSRTIHAADAIELLLLPRGFVDTLAAGLGRNDAWVVSLVEGNLSVTAHGESHACDLVRTTLAAFLAGDAS